MVCKQASAVLDELAEGLAVGASRKVDRGTGYMAAHVECLQQTELGPLFSVAHYYSQGGDSVPDPDVVFLRRPDGWAPISFQSALACRVAVHFHETGVVEVDEREQKELVRFANLFIKNVGVQQGLPTQSKRK